MDISLAAHHLSATAGYLHRAAGKEAMQASPYRVWETEEALKTLALAVDALGYELVKKGDTVADKPVINPAVLIGDTLHG